MRRRPPLLCQQTACLCSNHHLLVTMPIPEGLPRPFPPDADYTRQSFEVPGTRKPGQTGEYDVETRLSLDSDTDNVLCTCVGHYRNSTSLRSRLLLILTRLKTFNQALSPSSHSTHPMRSSTLWSCSTPEGCVRPEPAPCWVAVP